MDMQFVNFYRNLLYHRTSMLEGVRLVAFRNVSHLRRTSRRLTDKLGRPDWGRPWPDVQPLAVATRGYYASTRQLQETTSILRRLSRRLWTIRPTPPAARAAPIPTTRAVAQTGGL